ncbi:MAG: hypothetical protein KC501_02810 [Myxococcales bacterium]|nr:hypothetical protein [Myxococcales bacterium]
MVAVHDDEHVVRVAKEFFANTFDDPELAHCLLKRVGFPRSLIPEWKTALVFWDKVIDLIRKGVKPESLQRLFDEANSILHPRVGSKPDTKETRPFHNDPLDRSIDRSLAIGVISVVISLGFIVGFTYERWLPRLAPPPDDTRLEPLDHNGPIEPEILPVQEESSPLVARLTSVSAPEPAPAIGPPPSIRRQDSTPSPKPTKKRKRAPRTGNENARADTQDQTSASSIETRPSLKETLENEAKRSILDKCSDEIDGPMKIDCLINQNWAPVGITLDTHRNQGTPALQECVERVLRKVLGDGRRNDTLRPRNLRIAIL